MQLTFMYEAEAPSQQRSVMELERDVVMPRYTGTEVMLESF